MPLFGGRRDVSLFRTLNRELLNRIMDAEIDLYQIAVEDSNTNIYGEAIDKPYSIPIRLMTYIDAQDNSYEYNEFGPDNKQQVNFIFLRDDLRLKETYPNIGDIIKWNNTYWEISNIIDNQLFINKSDDTSIYADPNINTEDFGWQVSITCQAYMTRKTKLNIIET